jgi:hypothetical protein
MTLPIPHGALLSVRYHSRYSLRINGTTCSSRIALPLRPNLGMTETIRTAKAISHPCYHYFSQHITTCLIIFRIDLLLDCWILLSVHRLNSSSPLSRGGHPAIRFLQTFFFLQLGVYLLATVHLWPQCQ